MKVKNKPAYDQTTTVYGKAIGQSHVKVYCMRDIKIAWSNGFVYAFCYWKV